MTNPAENLLGKVLEDDWTVIEKIERKPSSTGGNFSVCYRVRNNDGEVAFLKAVNIARAFGMPNMMKVLEDLTVSHNRECEILLECKDKKMNKIIRILLSGELLPNPLDSQQITIPYVIFELAEGSLRDELNYLDKFDGVWALKSLHQVFVAVSQLHYNSIVHQDLKPSNVVLFKEKVNSKLADLGRADKKGFIAPHTNYTIAGDPTYAPPEQLYGYILADWGSRRESCDLFLLGSMITFYFTHTPITNLLKTFLTSDYHWTNWKGNYLDILPYLLDAFDNACIHLNKELENYFSDKNICDELTTIVRQLCHPDPEQRGHPDYKSGFVKRSPFLLNKYISRLNALGNKAEIIA